MENVGAQALRPAFNRMLVGPAIEFGLLRAGVLDRQLPSSARHLPVAAWAELGHPVWTCPTLAPDVFRQREHVGIRIQTDRVQTWAILVQLVQHLLVLAAYH